MKSNDAQIDVLLRRYAKHSSGEAPPDHLDADELTAFAEGSLPPAARASYVSHLAECDNCRQLVSQIAMTAGVAAKAERAESTEAERASWPQRLAAFFAPRTLRYAAASPAASPQNPRGAEVREESKVAENTVQPPKPLSETSSVTVPPVAKKSSETVTTEAQPSYAPPPPRESQGADTRSRQQQSVGGLASGPRKTASADDKYKTTDQAAAPTMAKDRAVDESNRAAANQTAQNNRIVTREKRSGPRRDQENVAQSQQLQIESTQKESTGTTSPAKPEAAPETRSVGGRKFRRQGGSWIDLKFKTSMSLRTITRGSDEFSSLDSGLRSIASQLSGEIIVVWKNKAYRIR